jgi:hypothetical protein
LLWRNKNILWLTKINWILEKVYAIEQPVTET